MKFDLDLDDLRRRESERIEWKRNVADIENVIETVAAFSNDFSNLGGGYVICGAEETKNAAGFQAVEFVGLTAERFKEIEGKVLSDCQSKVDPPIVPLVDEIDVPETERKILIFIVPSTEHAHSYRPSGKDSATYYIRIGKNTKEARGTLLRELLIRKKALEPWDRRPNPKATTSDVDLIIFREYLQLMGMWDPANGVEKYLSNSESLSAFVPPLMHRENVTNSLRPLNFSLLLFNENPARFFPGAYSILSVYPGEDRSAPIADRTEITGSIVQQAKQLLARLNIESTTAFDKTSPHPNQTKYPQRAIQEAVVNALVHRDYESDQPLRITIFSDRVEINSPGSLPRAVDKKLFLVGEATPYWRNQTLAFFFNKLQLAQAEGQGIPTIIRTMREEGCPAPLFNIGEDNLVCTLPAHPRHKLVTLLRQIEKDIIVGSYPEAVENIEGILKEDPDNFRAIELYCEVSNLLKRPQIILDFIKDSNVSLERFPSSTLVFIAETILLCNDEKCKHVADKILGIASSGKLEEKEVKRIAVGIRKIGDDSRAITFIDNAMSKIPSLNNHSSLLEIRAKAKIEMAKKCIDTARRRESSPKMKFLAWEQCREYLNDAERDLQIALQNPSYSIEKDYILEDFEFLNKLKSIAQKPEHTSNTRQYKRGPKSKYQNKS